MESETNNNEPLKDKELEAILFLKGETVSVKELAELLQTDAETVNRSLDTLEQRLKPSSGLSLSRTTDRVLLTTNPELGSWLQEILRYELQKDLGRAGRETLATILYYHPISKRDIDYIRGVNSATILRTLTIRGLIEKHTAENGLSSQYSPTGDLLAHLGLAKPEDLPEFNEVREKIGSLFSDSKTG